MKVRYSISEDGFCGRWFEGTIHKDYVVIVLPGTGTAEENAVKAFGYFHSAGYSTLMVAHSIWGTELPKDPTAVSVEHLDAAITLLRAEGDTHIALFGLSFGARYALLAATLLPGIEAVIAASPYDYLTEAVQGMLRPLNRSVHTWRGEELPYLRMEILHRNLAVEVIKLLFNREYGLHTILRYGYNSCTEREEARIPVEKIRADVLLLAPTQDTCWPSEQAVPRMEAYLRQANAGNRIQTILYPDGNHILAIDLDAIPKRKKKMQKFMKEGTGDADACDLTRKASIRAVLDFLAAWSGK